MATHKPVTAIEVRLWNRRVDADRIPNEGHIDTAAHALLAWVRRTPQPT